MIDSTCRPSRRVNAICPPHSGRGRGWRRLFAVALLCASGCSPFKVHTVVEPGVNFAGMKTYTWTSEMQEAIDDSTTPSLIRVAIDAELKERGYLLLAAGTPDFQIAYRFQTDIVVQKQFAAEYPSQVSGWFPDSGGSTYLNENRQNLLRVIIYDPEGKRQIWQGFVASRMGPDLPPNERQDVVHRAVHAVFDKFPPS